jgi:hypothetical protein
MRTCDECVFSVAIDKDTLKCTLVRDLIYGKLMKCEDARFNGLGIVKDEIKYLGCNPIGFLWKPKKN